MAEDNRMKIVTEVLSGGSHVAKVVTTVSNDPAVVGAQITRLPGAVGRPFWAWASLPAGTLAFVDFTGAPLVSNDGPANAAAIQAMLDNPPDAQALLTWA